MIELQVETEELFHRNQVMRRLREEFEFSEELTEECQTRGLDPELALSFLCQMQLHRQMDIPTAVGLVRHFTLTAQDAADQVLKCVEAELCDWDHEARRLIVRYDVSDEVKEDLARYQYPLPMVVQPLVLAENEDTGFLRFRKGSLLLKDNHHDGDICLDHLNRVNRVRMKLDLPTVLFVKNSWKNLDKQKADETKEDFEKRKRAFQRYDENAHDVFDRMGLMTEGECWLTHKYDFRGRTYCQGYYFTYQGNDWSKAAVAFANEEITL